MMSDVVGAGAAGVGDARIVNHDLGVWKLGTITSRQDHGNGEVDYPIDLTAYWHVKLSSDMDDSKRWMGFSAFATGRVPGGNGTAYAWAIDHDPNQVYDNEPHWIQFIRPTILSVPTPDNPGTEIAGAFVLLDPQMGPGHAYYVATGTTYCDVGLEGTPFYDQAFASRCGPDVQMFDRPSNATAANGDVKPSEIVNDKGDKVGEGVFRFDFDTYLVFAATKTILYHVQWRMEVALQNGHLVQSYELDLGASGPTNQFGGIALQAMVGPQFRTARTAAGGPWNSPEDVRVANPMFVF